MGDDLVLLALFGLLYVGDSYFLLHKHSVAFREEAGGRFRAILPSSNAGGKDRALHAFSLLPPLRPVYVSNLLPVSLSERGIASYVSQTLSETGRPTQPCGAVEYAGIRSARAEGKNVLVDGTPFVRCDAPEHAALIAGAVEEIVATGGAREREVRRRVMQAIVDPTEVTRILADYRGARRPLLLLCNAVFVVLFLLFPVLARWRGLESSLIATLVLLGVLLPPLCACFVSLHRRFSTGGAWDRIGSVFRFAVCPPCSIRANDHISRSLLARFHPAAVGLALCGEPGRSAFLGRILRDLRHPVRPDTDRREVLSVDESWRKELVAAIEETVRLTGPPRVPLAEAPERQDPSVVAYCPRCLAQFSASIDSCPDCSGVAPAPFPAPEDRHA